MLDVKSEPNFIWTNSPEYEEKLAKENKKSSRSRKKQKAKKEEDSEERKDLSSYFDANKKQTRKMKKKKLTKKEKKKLKKQKKRKTLKDQKIFRFRKKKYSKVEDFIIYLNQHFLEGDEIAREVLDNEDFFGWISKKSGIFDISLKKFTEIKEEIENN